jgi:CDP-paratose 2-epimerase
VYADTYKVRAASFRLTGLYGPRQFGGEDHGWVANFAIRNLLGRPLVIYGSGKQVRDILFATDVARAFWAFFQKGESGVYNIGGGPPHAISLLECISLLEKTTGLHADVQFMPARFGDLNYFVCDSTKALKTMGWYPEVKPTEGVPLLVEWVRQNSQIFQN